MFLSDNCLMIVPNRYQIWSFGVCVKNMPVEFHFDLDTAREALNWLKERMKEIGYLSYKGNAAMKDYDMDSADVYDRKIQKILERIREKGILFRDPDLALFDFPAVINSMPAYFCWKTDEDNIEYWHYVDEGFTGRKKITGREEILSTL